MLYLCQETLRCTAASKYEKGNPTLFFVTTAIIVLNENSRELFKLKSIYTFYMCMLPSLSMSNFNVIFQKPYNVFPDI